MGYRCRLFYSLLYPLLVLYKDVGFSTKCTVCPAETGSTFTQITVITTRFSSSMFISFAGN